MDQKIILVNSSTNLESGVTKTARVTVPDAVAQLPKEARNKEASKLLAQSSGPLRSIEESQLTHTVGSLLDGKDRSRIIQSGETVNIIYMAPHSRIYMQSQDHSLNLNEEVTPEGVFTELRTIIGHQIKEEKKRDDFLAKVQEMESSKGSAGFASKYKEFIALAANHMTLFAPILPSLTRWLSG